MRKVITIIVMLVLCTTSLMAQVSISSVYGVRLGDSESSVISAINSQGKRGEWKSSSKGRFYKIKSPTLGNCTFEGGTFRFSDGKLSKVTLYSSSGGTADPNFSGANPYYPDQFNSTASKFQRIFNTMKLDLMGKYGSPQLEDETRLVWKSSNGNQLTLEYDYQDDTNNYGWHDCFTRVAISYETTSGRSSNF